MASAITTVSWGAVPVLFSEKNILNTGNTSVKSKSVILCYQYSFIQNISEAGVRTHFQALELETIQLNYGGVPI